MADLPLPHSSLEGKTIEGAYSVLRVTYANPETGYAVVYLVPADKDIPTGFVAVGAFGEPRTGDCYRIEGVWRRDARHGMQVQVSSVTPQMPRETSAIERYLAGANIKGLGPHIARALVEHFGPGTFDMLQAGGARLEEVPGIGPVRAQTIREGWSEHQGIHELMVNLQGVAGLSASQAQRIYRQYGRESWLVVSRDPYRMAEEVRGFGFKTCDRIAASLGVPHDAPARIQAGVLHLLNEALADGHLWSPVQLLIAEAAALLQVPLEAVPPQIAMLIEQERAVRTQVSDGGEMVEALYLPRVYHTERRVAERLAYLLGRPAVSSPNLSPQDADRLAIQHSRSELTEEQRGAVSSLLTGLRLGILTGGPGTGKTTTVCSLIACLEALQVPYALCATTGRAAKQLTTSTGRPAATVHRHLGIGLRQDQVACVSERVLIVDESSMIDLWLLDQIVARLTEDTRLLLVGDVDQLPSVGPGAVLQDLIASAESGTLTGAHVTRLTHIFRQEAGDKSLIVLNCHRVRRGLRPITESDPESDYFEMLRDTPGEARELAVSLVTTRLPRFLQVPPNEVQVLAPMHGGEAGIRALNQVLQEQLNPPSPAKAQLVQEGVGASFGHGRVLRVGDKVRQTRNDYQKGVLNGDLGIITQVDLEERALTAAFDDRAVRYTFEELDELVHAWAMTVHSAQGSQWPAVVILMLTNHYVMLERNILYTALSRAQRMAVLITQEQAVRVAVAQDRSTRRRTNLASLLADLVTHPQAEPPSLAFCNPLFD
ncbi:MAG: SF1B family DNA helicase RecD2 [Anaerolineae bacterium]